MTDWGPLDFITLNTCDDPNFPPLMVLCRAPANDGWLAIEGGTGVIYNLFDSITYLYTKKPKIGSFDIDFGSRTRQAALLARAKWFHHPARAGTVGCPKSLRKLAARNGGHS